MNDFKEIPFPDVTVLITSFNASSTIAACLDSLRNQCTNRPFEIVLVDSGTDETANIVGANYPEVKLLRSPVRLYCGEARNRGIRESRAQLIAFLDADCVVPETWLEAVYQAHSRPYLAVSGSVHNGSKSLVSWAYYFCEFNLWVPAQETRTVQEAPGCALSLKRAAFERFGPFREGAYCSDTAFHWRMQAAGESVFFCPAITVHHVYENNWLDLLRHICEHRRHFAAMEIQERHLGLRKRLIAAAKTPLLPVLLPIIVAWRLRRSKSLYIPYLKAALPVFLGFCARAWGQFLGYLFRSRNSGQRRQGRCFLT